MAACKEKPDIRASRGLFGVSVSGGTLYRVRALRPAWAKTSLSLESRFDLAYNSAHAFCLAALRANGYRPQNRYVVFQLLPHTLGLGPEVWRILANAIRFFDYMLEKFPFRIHTVRTDRGHEWQALFHWHVEDQGIRHVYIKPRSPQLNGKVERSHRTDQQEFYQLLTYTGDVDLSKKLAAWEDFYNLDRPHGAHTGQTPYEALKRLLVNSESVSAG